MAYTKTNWVNGVTPVDQTNMNKIENELELLDNNTTTQSGQIGTLQIDVTTLQTEVNQIKPNYLPKVTTTGNNRRAYIVNTNGTQTMMPIDYFSIEGTNEVLLAVRAGDGSMVCNMPSEPESIPFDNYYVTNKGYVASKLSTKQNTLVSGTNIKTINNQTILGSGNINTKEIPDTSGHAGEFLKVGSSGVTFGSPVIGTNDGTNWTSLSVQTNTGVQTYNIPQGGGGSIPTLTGTFRPNINITDQSVIDMFLNNPILAYNITSSSSNAKYSGIFNYRWNGGTFEVSDKRWYVFYDYDEDHTYAYFEMNEDGNLKFIENVPY